MFGGLAKKKEGVEAWVMFQSILETVINMDESPLWWKDGTFPVSRW